MDKSSSTRKTHTNNNVAGYNEILYNLSISEGLELLQPPPTFSEGRSLPERPFFRKISTNPDPRSTPAVPRTNMFFGTAALPTSDLANRSFCVPTQYDENADDEVFLERTAVLSMHPHDMSRISSKSGRSHSFSIEAILSDKVERTRGENGPTPNSPGSFTQPERRSLQSELKTFVPQMREHVNPSQHNSTLRDQKGILNQSQIQQLSQTLDSHQIKKIWDDHVKNNPGVSSSTPHAHSFINHNFNNTTNTSNAFVSNTFNQHDLYENTITPRTKFSNYARNYPRRCKPTFAGLASHPTQNNLSNIIEGSLSSPARNCMGTPTPTQPHMPKKIMVPQNSENLQDIEIGRNGENENGQGTTNIEPESAALSKSQTNVENNEENPTAVPKTPKPQNPIRQFGKF